MNIKTKLIKGDKVTYQKSNEVLLIEGSVEFFDTENNELKTDKAKYEKTKEREM